MKMITIITLAALLTSAHNKSGGGSGGGSTFRSAHLQTWFTKQATELLRHPRSSTFLISVFLKQYPPDVVRQKKTAQASENV